MTEEVIIFSVDLKNLTFKALSSNGFGLYKLLVKSDHNKNIERLRPYMIAEILKISSEVNVVVRIRPIRDFIKQKDPIKKFDILIENLNYPWITPNDEFDNFFTFLSNIEGLDEFRIPIIKLYILRLFFKLHNIHIEVNKCYYCQTSFDIALFNSSLSSMVCYSCSTKNHSETGSKGLQKKISILKLLTNFWENRNNNKAVLTIEESPKNIESLVNTIESILTHSL